jgi:hypothetical protein
MSGEQLTRIWGILALLLLFYVSNTWLSSQGAQPILDVELLDPRRVAGALMALVVCPPLLALTATIGDIYRSRHADGRFWQAVPVPGIGSLDPIAGEARAYIFAEIFLVYILPILSFAHFGRIVLGADVCANEPHSPGLSVWSIPDLWQLNSGYRLDGWDAAAMKCNTGVTFWPLVGPILMIAWVAGSVVCVVRHLWRLSQLTR